MTPAAPSSPADPGDGGPSTVPGDQLPADPIPRVETPFPPYAAVIPMSDPDLPPELPVPPELADLVPARPVRRPVSSPGGSPGPAQPGSVSRGTLQAAAVPSEDHETAAVAPSSPGDPPAAAIAPPDPAGTPGEVAGPAEVALPTVEEVSRRLTSANARDALAALAMTFAGGMLWSRVSTRRRHSGWYF